MTVVAVLADPPRPGLALPELAASGPLTEGEAADLAAAMLQDTLQAVRQSGGDLLVNFRPDDALPEQHRTDTAPEAEVRALAAEALPDLDGVRFEPQVGSTADARAGNTVTHLLREEGADTVALVRPTAPLLARTTIDNAAMKLRRAPVVLGAAPDGRVHYVAFAEPIDFAGAFATPELATLADRGADAGLDVAFLELLPVLERPDDLLTVLPLLEARRTAGRAVPERTVAVLDDLGLAVVEGDSGPELVRA
ncbi:MAG: hypothetical protein ABEJ74_03645 [Haloferacaceae archaeon]